MIAPVRRLLLAWAALLLLLALLVGASFLRLGAFGPELVLLLAGGMLAIVALAFMRLRSTVPLGQNFALAAAVWLSILLALGSVDRFTRSDIPVPVSRYP